MCLGESVRTAHMARKTAKAAAQHGVRVGYIIAAFNGASVDDANSLRIHVAGAQPGSAATLTFWRDGKEQQVRVTLAELPPPQTRS